MGEGGREGRERSLKEIEREGEVDEGGREGRG